MDRMSRLDRRSSLMRTKAHITTCALLATLASNAEASDVTIYRLLWENDTFQAFNGSDRAYTNGIRFSSMSYSKDGTAVQPRVWVRALTSSIMPWVRENDPNNTASGWAIGQNMYTPSDITINPPDPTDRPYGGYLYFGLLNSIKGHTLGIRDFHRFEVDVGVVGPPSLAEQSQKLVHAAIHANRPRGWDYQIPSRFAASIIYDWEIQVFGPDWNDENRGPLQAELLFNVGTALGNVIADIHTGAMFRIGIDMFPVWPSRIKPTFNNPTLGNSYDASSEPSRGWSAVHLHEFYLWASVNGKEWLGNVFIDEALPAIKREYLVGDVAYGAVLGIFSRWELSYQQVFRSHEFRTQKENNSFGTVGVSYVSGLQ